MSLDAAFWTALGQIIGVNIILSGDNAVVIALACRNLPERYRNKAIFAGSAGAILLRVIFSVFVVELMAFPYLKFVGGLLLLWIGVKLIIPEGDEHGGPDGAHSLWGAVRTVIVADAVMSLDNVIAIAAAARGDLALLIIGLAISIPLIIVGSQLILKILVRYPILVVAGGGLLGWIAGEVIVTDPAFRAWVDANAHWLHVWAKLIGAVVVIVIGKTIAARRVTKELEPEDLARADIRHEATEAEIEDLAKRKGETMTGDPTKILVPVDGSEHALRAVRRAIELGKIGQGVEIHLLNVQPPLPGSVVTFIDKPTRDDYHREEAEKAMASARALVKASGVRFEEHIGVGDPGSTIVAFCKRLGCGQIIMGSHGLGAALQLVLGSVAQDVVRETKVPVTVVK